FKTSEKKKVDDDVKKYNADEIKRNDEYINDQLKFIERISNMFKSITDFVEVCVNRTWKMDTKRPTKEKVVEVNKKLDEMYKALPTTEGRKIINDYLDEQNKSLEKYDVEASFKPKKLTPSRKTLKLH
ncbi:hypothetical protein, partial [Pseudomonas helleri]|uniref:hypothetical protein n=1 Tax=Pseudomonas helleri TaxID=1608996 RepID=UPI00188628C8